MKTTKEKVGMKKLMSFVMILIVVTIANTAFGVESETEKTPRETFVLNRGWEFFRPEPAAVYEPPKETLVAQGKFLATGKASVVRFEKRVARQVCLVGRSSHQGEFVSVAEFELLDSTGKPLARNEWTTAFATSAEYSTNNPPEAAFDGKVGTFWHSVFKSKVPLPQSLIIDLGRDTAFYGVRYLPRQDGSHSGKLRHWELHATKTAFEIPERHDPHTGDVPWETVTLPHTVRLEPLNASGGRNYQGICWYRRTLTPDASWAEKTLHLRFEGAMQVAEVWLNGEKVATHTNGYQPFTIDLSGQLPAGKPSTLLVRLDNSDNPEVPPGTPQSRLDFTYFGGLYRDVLLDVTDPLHITDEILADEVAGGGVFVTYPKVTKESAIVRVQVQVQNNRATVEKATVRCTLSRDGESVKPVEVTTPIAPGEAATVTIEIPVVDPALWHPNHPSLYSLETTVIADGQAVDQRTERIGIRHLDFKPEGLFINGEKHCALGFNRHQDHPYVGYALSNEQHYRDAKKMRDAGMTSFRSHYPQDPAFMDACDELGILTVVSNPGWQFFGNATWVKRTLQNAREMVRRDRNRPSVVIWEPFPNESPFSEAYARQLHEIMHEEHPGDQCFTAANGHRANAAAFVDVIYSQHPVSGKSFWSREWGDSVDNWYDQQGRVRIARGWGELPLITQAVNHTVKLDTMLKKAGGGPSETRLAGAGLWAGIDTYRGYHHQPFHGGVLDLFRLPKFSYYMLQSQRDPRLKIPGVDCGPMIFIANYASAYSPASVLVFSNCDEVRFSENGKVMATQKPDPGYVLDHPPFTFKAKAVNAEASTYFMNTDAAANSGANPFYRPAEYKAEGLINGEVVTTHTIRAPGVMRAITLEADLTGRALVADGSDWIRVYARIVDGRGTTYPFANELVTFTVEGQGEIIGDATIGANPVKAEAGIATVLIRSTSTPGEILVKATAFGLAPGMVTVRSEDSGLTFR